MILTLDKDLTASMLFNSGRKACEAYMIFFLIAIPFGMHVKCAATNVKRNNKLLNNKLNKIMISAKDSKGFRS